MTEGSLNLSPRIVASSISLNFLMRYLLLQEASPIQLHKLLRGFSLDQNKARHKFLSRAPGLLVLISPIAACENHMSALRRFQNICALIEEKDCPCNEL